VLSGTIKWTFGPARGFTPFKPAAGHRQWNPCQSRQHPNQGINMSDTAPDKKRPARILVVEDDELQARLLGYGLTGGGFEVDTVSCGLSALRKMTESCYDVALVDYNIPDLDGLASARLVGDLMGQTARPILIALTGTPERLNERENGGESAFDAVLGKPYDLPSLVSVIGRLLASAPDPAIKQAAAASVLEQAWDRFFMGPERPEASGPARILVVEDDPQQTALMVSALASRGYSVDTSPDGLDAVRKINGGCYDLALIDYNLPEIDGLTTVKLVHDLMTQSDRPRLIAITSLAARLREKERLADLLVDEIVEKSSGLVPLLRAVDHHLRVSPNPATREAAARTMIAGRGA
jgi:two-component system, sensor histidine kinase and response regulator